MGLYGAWLTPQGRMVADLELLHRGDWMLAAVAPGLGAMLASRFDGLVFAEDVAVADVTADWTELAVTGADAAGSVGRAVGIDPPVLAALPELAQADWSEGFVVRAGGSPFPLYRVLAPPASRADLIGRLEAQGTVRCDAVLAEVLRIEAGRPAWGVDLTEDTIPLEAGLLDRAISTSKGCYVGQEVVIRILHRGGGRVARRLARLACDATVIVPPAPGTALSSAGKAVGHVTSAAYSPARQRIIGLGYVHRDAATIGARLAVGDPPRETIEIVGFAG